MKHLMACHECDLLIDLHEQLADDRVVCCPRCHHQISSGQNNALDKVLALSITATLVLIFANSFPFLAFEAKGQSRSINLFQTVLELFEQGYPTLSVLIFCFIILLPLAYLLFLLILTLPIKLRIKRSPPIILGRAIDALLPWAMAEVFLIGVLVALIKVVSMANIVLGISFWAYILFTILFLAISTIVDSHRLWHWVEHGE